MNDRTKSETKQHLRIVDVSRPGSQVRETEMELSDTARSWLTVSRHKLEMASGKRGSERDGGSQAGRQTHALR